MIALMSIKPDYANKIIDGTKLFEFRKSSFKRSVSLVIVYSTSPEKKIIGAFKISDILEDKPKKIWEKCKHAAGINEKKYFEYYNNSAKAVSIGISKAISFNNKLSPSDMFLNFYIPQSYRYMSEQELLVLANKEPQLNSFIN